MADIFFLYGRAGPGNIFLAFRKRSADGMQAGNKLALLSQFPENFFPYAGHDVHIANNVRTVCNFYADLGNRGVNRSHGKRNHIHRAPFHASLIKDLHRRL
jgi:hypothetical protein